MVEYLLGKKEVKGSIPLISTIKLRSRMNNPPKENLKNSDHTQQTSPVEEHQVQQTRQDESEVRPKICWLLLPKRKEY